MEVNTQRNFQKKEAGEEEIKLKLYNLRPYSFNNIDRR
jgi:hypothetical protein